MHTVALPAPSADAAAHSLSPQTGEPLGACRTCLMCRKRKTRCDGKKPRCGLCAHKDYHCQYPQDGRKAIVRGKKADIRQLRQEMDDLRRETLRHKRTDLPGPSGLLELVDQGLPTSTTLDDNQPYVAHQPASETDVCDTQILPLTPSRPISRPQSSQVEADRPHVAESAPAHNSAAYGPQPDHDQLLTPHLELDDTDTRVYGATSLLHNPPSVTASNAARSVDTDTQAKANRHELISNAAISKQEETLLYTTPDLLQHADFDGLPRDVGLYLLNLHWNRQHLSYLITYRPAIMHSFIHGGPHMNKMLLNAIFFSTCLYDDRFSPQPRSNEGTNSPGGFSPGHFYNRVKTLLTFHMDKPDMPTIAALLLCGSSLVPHGEQGTGWLLCGMAYRMIVDLGYHLNTPASIQEEGSKLSATEVEIRKRIYWGAYVCDTFQSLFLGRQPSLYKTHSTTPPDYLDVFEELEDWRPYSEQKTSGPTYPGRPTLAISTFSHLRSLCTIANGTIDAFYTNTVYDESEAYRTRDRLRTQLESWGKGLPSTLDFRPEVHQVPPPPHQITLHTTYWAIVILTEQPFLRPSQFEWVPDVQHQQEARSRCVEAALRIWKILKAYREAFTFRRAQYSISYAAYCAVLVILQHAPQNGGEDYNYDECIHFFWTTLLEHQRGCSRGLKRPLVLLKSLMRHMDNTRNCVSDDSAYMQETVDILQGLNNDGDGFAQNSETLFGEDALSWLAAESGDLSFTDDTVFGMFT